MSKKARNATNVTAIIAWVVAIWMIIPAGLNLGFDFRTKSAVSTTRQLPATADTLFVRIARPANMFLEWDAVVNDTRGRIKLNTANFDVMDDTLVLNDIEIKRYETSDTTFSVKTHFIARGKTIEQAKSRAAKINYSYQLNGEHLVFDPYFTLGGAPYRAQEVKVSVYVPKGKWAVMQLR
jgi:hypothetical protein